MALSVAKLRGEVTLDTSQAETGLKKLSSELKNFSGQGQSAGASVGSIFSGVLGANVFMNVAGQVRNMASAAMDSYADFERLGYSLTSLQARELVAAGGASSMADALNKAAPAAQETLKWVQQLAIESPFDNEGIAKSFQLAASFGFTTAEAKRLTTAMVDYSAATGKTTDVTQRMMLSLGQMRAQGKVTGMEIRELALAGLPVDQILAKAFNKTTAEIKTMREDGVIPANLAIDALVSSIEQDFGGSAKRMTNTFSGLLSSLRDIAGLNLRNLFGGMFESARPYLIEFTEALKPGGPLSQGVKDLGATLGKSAGEGMQAMAGLVNQARPLAAALASIPPSVYELAAAFAAVAYITPSAINGIGSLVGILAGGLTPVGAFAIGVAAVATALVGYKLAVDAATQKTREFAAVDLPGQLDKIATSGGGATRQIMAFADAIKATQNSLMNGDFWTRAFADTTAVQTEMFGDLSNSLAKTSGDYGAYLAAMQEAAKGQKMYIDSSGQLYQVHQITADSNYKVATSYKALSEAEYEALKNQQLLKLVGTSAMDAGAGMAVATPEVNKFRDAMTELVDPTKATAEQQKKAADKAQKLADEMIRAKQAAFNLAEQMKGASGKEVKKSFLDSLVNSPGFMQLPNATTMIQNLGKAFGLVDDKSLKIAASQPILNQALATGRLSWQDYVKAVDQLNQQGGKFDPQAFVDKFQTSMSKATDATSLNTVMQGLGPSVSNAMGLNVQAGVTIAQSGIDATMTNSASQAATAFSNGIIVGTATARQVITDQIATPISTTFVDMNTQLSLAQGNLSGVDSAAKSAAGSVGSLAKAIDRLHSKTITITVFIHTIDDGGGAFVPGSGSRTLNNNGLGGTVNYDPYEYQRGGFANGLDFVVPPGYPNDSYYMPMRVQSGERVTVTPAGEWNQTQTQAAPVNVTVNVQQIGTEIDWKKAAVTVADEIRRRRL